MAAQRVMKRFTEIAKVSCEKWLNENAAAFAAQAAWHVRYGHPLADIIVGPGAMSWDAGDHGGRVTRAKECPNQTSDRRS
jgi:hypothetical protein